MQTWPLAADLELGSIEQHSDANSSDTKKSSSSGSHPVFSRQGALLRYQDSLPALQSVLDLGNMEEFSLELLVHLSCSAVIQQRSIALQILNKIVHLNPDLQALLSFREDILLLTLGQFSSAHLTVSTLAFELLYRLSTLQGFRDPLLLHSDLLVRLLYRNVSTSNLPTFTITKMIISILSILPAQDLLKHPESYPLLLKLQELSVPSTWPPTEENQGALPMPDIVDMLARLAESSHDTAVAIQEILDPVTLLIPFLVIPFWQFNISIYQETGRQMAIATVQLLAAFSKHQLGFQGIITLQPIWLVFFRHAIQTDDQYFLRRLLALALNYFEIATSGEESSPINFAQIQEWGYEIARFINSSVDTREALLAEALRTVTVWRRGLSQKHAEIEWDITFLQDRLTENLALLCDKQREPGTASTLSSILHFRSAWNVTLSIDKDRVNLLFADLIQTYSLEAALPEAFQLLLFDILPYQTNLLASKLTLASLTLPLANEETLKLRRAVIFDIAQICVSDLAISIPDILLPFFTSADGSSQFSNDSSSKIGETGWPIAMVLKHLDRPQPEAILRQLPKDYNYDDYQLIQAGLLAVKAIINHLSSKNCHMRKQLNSIVYTEPHSFNSTLR